jgi:hypothetical protein
MENSATIPLAEEHFYRKLHSSFFKDICWGDLPLWSESQLFFNFLWKLFKVDSGRSTLATGVR